MSFADLIKNSVLETFSSTVTIGQIVLALVVAFLAALIIIFIYKLTSDSPTVNKSFVITIVMTSMISAMIVTTITSNLALSLGMVGALSIVRFRTAIKNPLDTVYMFWSVAAGITAGARAYVLCIFSCLVIGLVVFIFTKLSKAGGSAYVLVVRASSPEAADAVKQVVKASLPGSILTSNSRNAFGAEFVWEVSASARARQEVVDKISSISGVSEVSMTLCSSSAI